jgi:AcrR family transcriptional regulator
VTPPAGRAPRADAVRNRRRILDAAEAVLAEDGLSAPVAAIARRAGLGVGSVYRAFPTKEDLYAAIVVEHVRRLAGEATGLAGTGEPAAVLVAFLRRVMDEGGVTKAVAQALVAAGVDPKEATRASGATDELRAAVGDLLAPAQADGSVRRDLTAGDVLALLAATHQAAPDDPAARSRLVDVVLDGLGQPSGRTTTSS